MNYERRVRTTRLLPTAEKRHQSLELVMHHNFGDRDLEPLKLI
jgi:hypothetical protein